METIAIAAFLMLVTIALVIVVLVWGAVVDAIEDHRFRMDAPRVADANERLRASR